MGDGDASSDVIQASATAKEMRNSACGVGYQKYTSNSRYKIFDFRSFVTSPLLGIVNSSRYIETPSVNVGNSNTVN